MKQPRTPISPEILQQLTRLRPAIQGYALAITADHQLAEDVYQEVAALVSSDPTKLPDGPAALPWLREVARRKALELLRPHRRAGARLSEEVVEQLAEAFTARDHSSELSDRLARCVAQLASDHRAILVSHYDENLSAEEISTRVGRSVQGVYAVLKRVRRALARCMRRGITRGQDPWREVLS